MKNLLIGYFVLCLCILPSVVEAHEINASCVVTTYDQNNKAIISNLDFQCNLRRFDCTRSNLLMVDGQKETFLLSMHEWVSYVSKPNFTTQVEFRVEAKDEEVLYYKSSLGNLLNNPSTPFEIAIASESRHYKIVCNFR